MAKISLLKNNFTSGELSPHIWMRTDLQQFRNGAKEVVNMTPIVEGGLKKRGGTKLLSVEQGAVRILPFNVSHTNNYIVVFKPNQIEILSSDGTLIKTFESSYTADQISKINYCQSRYNLWLVHEDHPVSWIRCSEDFTNWAFDSFRFTVPPLEEVSTPYYPLTPSGQDAGSTITLTAAGAPDWTSTKVYSIGQRVRYNNTYYEAIADSTNVVPTTTASWKVVTGVAIDCWKATDVGKFVFINSGIVQITQFVNTTQVRGEVFTKLNAVIQAIAGSWILKESIFNDTYGYPRTITYFQQRLVLGGTKKYPNYIWLSRVGEEPNFLTTTSDGDAFTVAASSEQLSNVLHLSQSRGIAVFCGGSELAINAQDALTPTNANILEHTAYGITESIKPIKVGSELVFVQRGSERVRTLVYDYSQDGLVSNELSVLATHIGEEGQGFRDLAYQQEPDSIIWFVLNNGKLATLTLDREQSVISWARHDIGGHVISVTALPSNTGADKVYFLVHRNGSVQIEQLKEDLLLDTAIQLTVNHSEEEGCTVSHSLIGNLGDQVAAYYKDATHTYAVAIEGREGDKLYLDCDEDVDQIFVGRKFTAKVSILPPELNQVPSTSNPALFKVDHMNLYLYKSINPKVNGEIVELKEFDDDPLEKPKPFTGQKRISLDGWNTYDNFKLEISQDEPLPFHITATVLELNINDR